MKSTNNHFSCLYLFCTAFVAVMISLKLWEFMNTMNDCDDNCNWIKRLPLFLATLNCFVVCFIGWNFVYSNPFHFKYKQKICDMFNGPTGDLVINLHFKCCGNGSIFLLICFEINAILVYFVLSFGIFFRDFSRKLIVYVEWLDTRLKSVKRQEQLQKSSLH